VLGSWWEDTQDFIGIFCNMNHISTSNCAIVTNHHTDSPRLRKTCNTFEKQSIKSLISFLFSFRSGFIVVTYVGHESKLDEAHSSSVVLNHELQ
jgi:hypothetical protein